MILQNEETTRRPVYTIPGLIELEKTFDNIMITGAHALPSQIDSYLSRRTRRNVTDYEQEKNTDFLNYYFFTQVNTFVSSESLPRYIFLRSFSQRNLTSLARTELEKTSNKEIAKQAYKILDALEIQLQNYDISVLPPIRIGELDDGRIIIEWIFDNFRMGFNLEINLEESGYFLVSDKSAGEIRSSGYLKGLKLETLIQSSLTLILNN